MKQMCLQTLAEDRQGGRWLNVRWKRVPQDRCSDRKRTTANSCKTICKGHRVTKCKNVIEWPTWVLHSVECPASSLQLYVYVFIVYVRFGHGPSQSSHLLSSLRRRPAGHLWTQAPKSVIRCAATSSSSSSSSSLLLQHLNHYFLIDNR